MTIDRPQKDHKKTTEGSQTDHRRTSEGSQQDQRGNKEEKQKYHSVFSEGMHRAYRKNKQ